ncbi:3-deoxy-manno-octulosonate cytidylyltransferase [Novosphingobium sp. P6W]|uniref:3-deoxy-manno-octulosonate cytidylyltransferase n=1 Tax=Novosphingobium sp. P6W TaxID=1609758 RepID=UPI0005C2C7B5|nr:manno-octulosonate cytidylyltransferase [Novosphingobium sp. P6W]AXB80745.1 3-deoxy-manno-octulosonate cytidylyltransferase [Novosphingobium sp. P6W]KIS29582.1 3-deoxy-manno-octulosonate cytidylyltransferase [Novosphingobium sp. P6W]
MNLPSFAIIIPARYASTRYPGKPLVPLRGCDGQSKTLIRRSWECAMSVEGATGVWVATDDERIQDEVLGFGGQVVMTDEACANGTERCADAIARLGDVAEVIVNLQGDAPLSPAFVVHDLVRKLVEDPQAAMATPGVRCSRSVYRHLADDAAQGRVGGTTVVCNSTGRALYFSKRLLPYLPSAEAERDHPPVNLHLGLYAYRPEALRLYNAAAVSELEQLEGLEQLRFLDIGQAVAVVHLDPLSWDSIELNNPSDVEVIERILEQRGIA